MIMNFIAFIICMAAAIWQGCLGNIGFVIAESALALLNLPFAIKWIRDLFDKN